MVSILQALASEARLLIMDEPTASLSEHERSVVFEAIRRLRDNHGTSVLFISHFLDEIMELCQHVTVLRDGVSCWTSRATRSTSGNWSLLSSARSVAGGQAAGGRSRRGCLCLKCMNFASPTGSMEWILLVRAGEIVGLAGLFGSGRSEIMHAIYGADTRATEQSRLMADQSVARYRGGSWRPA